MNAAPARTPPATPSSAATLRRIGLLPARRRLFGGGRLLRRRRLPRGRLPCCRFGGDRAQRALEVVEDEPDGGIRSGRRRDPCRPVRHDEDAALVRRSLELDERTPVAGLDL